MKLSDTFFSWSRFANYFKKVLVEDRKRLLQRIITVFGLLMIFSAIISHNRYEHYLEGVKLGFTSKIIDPALDGLMPLFIFGLFIGSVLSVSLIMEPMGNKTGRIYNLMFPATSFEKYIARWVIYTIGFVVLYYLLFLLVDVIRVGVFSVIYPEIDLIAITRPYAEIVALKGDIQLGFIVSIYFFAQSLFALGSSLWPKYAFLKTFTAITIIGAAFSALLGASMNLFYRPEYVYRIPLLTEDEWFAVFSCGILLVTLLFWWLAYKRFKEMEIINRW